LSSPHNLPEQLTSFIGREREIAEVKRLVATTRLLTLTGAGGTGKTRLSLKVAEDLLHDYADGVWFIELATLAEPALVPQVIAAALGVRQGTGLDLVAALSDYLRSRKTLVVLDNCEHLITACASIIGTLIRACPHLQVLATSREALGIPGELVWPVPTLSLPDPREQLPLETLKQYEAIRLFVDRAHASRLGFSMTPQNAPYVAQLCYQLDGMPLAIELAAARIRVLSVEQIVAHLNERFRLLTSGSPTAEPRQQTLEALMDWSYELLADAERALLRTLSVFSGSFTIDSVTAVCGSEIDEYEILDLLEQLVGKSLLLVDERDGKARYRMLETIRQYAGNKLRACGEQGTARRRHQEWYVSVAEQAQQGLLGENQKAWLNVLEMEHDNFRAALEWSIKGEGEPEFALRLAGALWRFWDIRGYHTEGRRWVEDALCSGGDAPPLVRAKALNAAGNLSSEQGDYERAKALYQEALSLRREVGDKRGTANSLNNLGVIARRTGDYETAAHVYEECLVIFRELGDEEGKASVLDNLGFLAQCRSDYARAEELYTEALAVFQELGDVTGVAVALNNLGEVAYCRGDHGKAEQFFKKARDLAEELDDKLTTLGVLNNLANLASRRGDYEGAVALYRESLELCKVTEHSEGIAECLAGMAVVASEINGQKEQAARLFAAAEALRESLGTHLTPNEQEIYEAAVAKVRSALGERAFSATWAAGRRMPHEEAVAFALALPFSPNGTTPSETKEHPSQLIATLTKREIEVLRFVASGLTDGEVAEKLGLSPRTIHSHLHSIYGKLGVTSRSAAVRFAIENKLI
jgi:non-specific serine/threonine protein kinase